MEELKAKLYQKLESILNFHSFALEKSESGLIASRPYDLGKKILFFQLDDKVDSLRAIINVRVTNEPVSLIFKEVNEVNAAKSTISLSLSFLAKKMDNSDANFERKLFDGQRGSTVTKTTLDRYIENFSGCLSDLIMPFLDQFQTQESFDSYINTPILNDSYNFDQEPIWKDAIISLIVANLTKNEGYQKLFEIWISKNLPSGHGFDTKKELVEIDKILTTQHKLL